MKILIIEDESRIAKRIERMARNYFLNILETLNTVDSLQNGLEHIKKEHYDLVLLDLNLNGYNGFEILSTVVSQSFHTIIISAQRDQALTAFEYGVLDFVPKPFNQTRLEQAFNRVSFMEKTKSGNIKFLAIKKRGRIQLMDVKNLIYVKGAGVYTELFFGKNKKELHDKSLEKLEQLLPSHFERIHKSYLLKMTEVREIIVQSGGKYTVELKNGETLPIGRTKYKEIKSKWF